MDLLSTRQKLVASNMANIDTPGYRTVGIDFEAEMRQAIADVEFQSEDALPAAVSPGRNLGQRKASSQPKIHAVDGLIVRPDGNNVSMDRESLNLAAAQLRFKLGVNLLKGEFAGMMSAIHADAK